MHPFFTVLENMELLLPGIQKGVGIFYSKKESRIVALETGKPGEIHELDISNALERVREARAGKELCAWTNASRVPFSVQERERRIQMKFDYDFEENVLLMRFPELSDEQSDILLIYFKEQIGSFKLTNVKDPVQHLHKSFAEKVVYHAISLFISTDIRNKQIYQKMLAAEIQSHKSHEELKEEHQLSLKNITAFFIEKLSTKTDVAFKLTESALQKLTQFKGKLAMLEPILEDAATVALNRPGADENGIVLIRAEDVILKTPEKADATAKESEQQPFDRYATTVTYLERYERAIEWLMERGEKITGQNIGKACHPPVSAAAISDNLKKHDKKIVALLNKYPEKWQLLRTKFRPVGKLVETAGHASGKQVVAKRG